MSGTFLLFVLLAVAAFVVAVTKSLLVRFGKSGSHGAASEWPVYAKRLLTPAEQKCFHRLRIAYPDHVVMAQVALSQILGIKKGHGENAQSVRNRYRLLVVDFVVCNKDFSIAAVFELDDRSHDEPSRQDADARKEAALKAAGISLHRLNAGRVPDVIELRSLLVGTEPELVSMVAER